MMRKRAIVAAALVCMLGPPAVIFGYRCVMHQVGYSGSGTVRNKCGLPYGMGMFFEGLRVDGPVHYAYKTGPRGVDCLFVGASDGAAVREWALQASGGDFRGIPTIPEGGGLADELPIDIHSYMGARSHGDVAATLAQETPIVRRAMIKIVYREATGRVAVDIYSPWSDLRHSFWGESRE